MQRRALIGIGFGTAAVTRLLRAAQADIPTQNELAVRDIRELELHLRMDPSFPSIRTLEPQIVRAVRDTLKATELKVVDSKSFTNNYPWLVVTVLTAGTAEGEEPASFYCRVAVEQTCRVVDGGVKLRTETWKAEGIYMVRRNDGRIQILTAVEDQLERLTSRLRIKRR